MPSYNHITLVGHVTREPELKYISSGTAVVTVGLATNERYTSNGEKKERTCFIDCQLWARTAESFAEHAKKGSCVLIEGSLQFEQWEKDGQRRSKHIVNGRTWKFMGSPPQSTPEPAPTDAPVTPPAGGGGPPDNIPFSHGGVI